VTISYVEYADIFSIPKRHAMYRCFASQRPEKLTPLAFAPDGDASPIRPNRLNP
jgi:hypothetical protein